MTVSADITPEVEYSKIIWKSTNPGIAKVSEDGYISAIAEGKTAIIAYSLYSDASATFELAVNKKSELNEDEKNDNDSSEESQKDNIDKDDEHVNKPDSKENKQKDTEDDLSDKTVSHNEFDYNDLADNPSDNEIESDNTIVDDSISDNKTEDSEKDNKPTISDNDTEADTGDDSKNKKEEYSEAVNPDMEGVLDEKESSEENDDSEIIDNDTDNNNDDKKEDDTSNDDSGDKDSSDNEDNPSQEDNDESNSAPASGVSDRKTAFDLIKDQIRVLPNGVVSYNGVHYYLASTEVKYSDLIEGASVVTTTSDIVKINQLKGTIRFKKSGSATIVADNGKKQKIVVFGKKPLKITIPMASEYELPLDIMIGTAGDLIVNKSDNASLTTNGVLTAKKEGTVKLKYSHLGKKRTLMKIKIKK